MAISAQTLLTRARTTLLDPNQDYWSDSELLGYLNEGVKALCEVKPDAYVVTAPITLIQGSIKQTISPMGFQFLQATRNLSPTLQTIRQIERNALDHADINWPATQDQMVTHFMFDPRNTNVFYVYPAPIFNNQTIEVIYSSTPPDLVYLTDSIPIDNVYDPPLEAWVLGKAYQKNAKRGDSTKATFYMTMFTSLLGLKAQVENTFNTVTPDRHP